MSTKSTYLVQRRLPGTQGDNGCFADAGSYEATSPADALEQHCSQLSLSSARVLVQGNEFRVCLMPHFEWFRPQVESNTTHRVKIGRSW